MGRVEAYSCKRVAADTKLCNSLETKIMNKSSGGQSISPFGPLLQKNNRNTLIDLICALNLAFPDYDFSDLIYGDYFVKEQDAYDSIDKTLLANISNYEQIKDFIHDAVDQEIALDECDTYSFNPDPDNNPFMEEGHLWSFNYFFYNRSLKKILLFAVYAYWKENRIEEEIDDEKSYDYNIFNVRDSNSMQYVFNNTNDMEQQFDMDVI